MSFFGDYEKQLLYKAMEKLSENKRNQTIERMGQFAELLIEKNKVINLTAIKEPVEVVYKHFIDSLELLKVKEFEGKRIIDVGCGAGFPGMPLKLYNLDFDVVFLDSTKKKLDFIKEAGELIGFNAVCLNERAEAASINPEYREKFDIVLSRAVAPLNVLSELCLPFLKTGGYFLPMKKYESDEEVFNASSALDKLKGSLENIHEYELSDEKTKRRIIIIRKTDKTPAIFPRRFSKINSSPL